MRLTLGLALLAAAIAAVGAQENAACMPLQQPSGQALKAAGDNGITNPALLDTLVKTLPDPAVRQWANDLFDIWGRLTRQLIPDVSQNTQIYTMLPVPNPFVVPGARFRESIRTYYLNRSQPPLYSAMVAIVYEATQDLSILRNHLPAILLEHAYWTSPPKQVVAVGPTGQRYNVSRYYARWQQPRPESYIEDLETARKAGLPTDPPDADTQQLWRDLASGAESGWDYSTRWFADGENLTTIRTTKILPADLNGYLLQMEENIADFAAELGCTALEQQYRQLAANRREALNTLFWSNDDSQWHDLVCTPAGVEGNVGSTPEDQAVQDGIVTRVCNVEQLTDPFASNWVPMWAGAVPAGSMQIAQRFLSTVYATYAETGRMYEKFNAEQIGIPGGGGEYEVVDGFGWTNGASLDLMQRFGFSTT
ncbi:putative trehalase [Chlorella sorokiniana]|uniref:Trehalase n=1 Tax=Chlorella sorokiniana TaxID=3076 RepID=A0A2P6TF19_CHLSO|nr:putative trehalase [Chlorella sorokiniana]|eukprot:PRW32561.1 putative trehalase [Chlorella sorokiniana]